MGVYDRSIATAKRLIAKYGAPCSWQQPAAQVETSPGYVEEGAVPDPIPVEMAFFSPRDVGRGSQEFLALLANTEIPVGQEIGLLAGGLPFEPSGVDHVIRDGAVLTVKSIDRIAPSGIPVMYFITVAP